MSAQESDVKHWTDPKDYGLPFVEITPIRSYEEPDMSSDLDDAAAIAIADESDAITADQSEFTETASNTAGIVDTSGTAESLASAPGSELIEKKSSGWIWAVILIAVGIVAVIVWQIQVNKEVGISEPEAEITEKSTQQPTPTVNEVDDSTTADQNQTSVTQDSVTSSGLSNPNVSKPAQSGTTIANTATGNLIRVESKAERAQYFIIVGSLPNEKMALAEANKYLGRSGELYLISPIDGGKNYRLALAKFASFRMAAAKLEEIKTQYTEELWILKY